MGISMNEYLERVDNRVTELLDAIFEIDQNAIEVNSGATKLYEEMREKHAKLNSFSEQAHLDQAQVYKGQIKDYQIKNNKHFGEKVEKCGQLIIIAYDGLKEVHGVTDGKRETLKNKIELKYGSGHIELVGTKGLDVIDLVWEGRNQSVHYKEGLNNHVKTVFKKLKKDYPGLFDNFEKENMSYEVVKLLDWLLDVEDVIPNEEINTESDGYKLLDAIDLKDPLPESEKTGYHKFRNFMSKYS